MLIKMAQKQPDYMDLFWINTDESGATAQLNREGTEPIRETYTWEDAKAGLTELQSFERRGVLMMKGGGYREGDSEGIPINVQRAVDRVAAHPVNEARVVVSVERRRVV